MGYQSKGYLRKAFSPTLNPSLSHHIAKIPIGVGEVWDALFSHPREKILIWLFTWVLTSTRYETATQKGKDQLLGTDFC